MKINFEKVHDQCGWHEEAIINSKKCGCFHCLNIFKPTDIVEWIDDNMHIYRISQNWQVSTNFIFTDGISSCWRFQTANLMLEESEGGITVEEGMDILQECSQNGWTLWSNIYNMETKQVEICVNQDYQRTYRFHF